MSRSSNKGISTGRSTIVRVICVKCKVLAIQILEKAAELLLDQTTMGPKLLVLGGIMLLAWTTGSRGFLIHGPTSSLSSGREGSTLRMRGGSDLEVVEGIKAIKTDKVLQGTVLVAKSWESSHFTTRQCLFVFHHNDEEGSRAVILERPTAFTLSELAPGTFDLSPFAEHNVFLGGERGGDMAILLHPYSTVPGARPVGSGLFYGGMRGAERMLFEQEDAGEELHGLDPQRFKLFFNYMGFAPGELEKQVSEDMWDVVELNPEAVLRQGVQLERELWGVLRRHYLPREDSPPASSR